MCIFTHDLMIRGTSSILISHMRKMRFKVNFPKDVKEGNDRTQFSKSVWSDFEVYVLHCDFITPVWTTQLTR